MITLLTARYNWQDDTLTTGQREIASLWSVDERTVKREMARLRDLGWLILKRPAARGRVACYGLGLDAISAQTCQTWPAVGPDYVARMGAAPPQPEPGATIVPFPQPGEGVWGRIGERLRAEDPALFAAWFAPLISLGDRDGVLRLKAPSRFHANFVLTHHTARLNAHARMDGLTVEIGV